MGRAQSTHVRVCELQTFWSKELKRKDNMTNLSINVRIILKRLLERDGARGSVVG
jgi:hypothetical protein